MLNTKLIVYDILGREVATLLNEYQTHGHYEITFDGGNLAAGTYFYQLICGKFIDIKKMVLIK